MIVDIAEPQFYNEIRKKKRRKFFTYQQHIIHNITFFN